VDAGAESAPGGASRRARSPADGPRYHAPVSPRTIEIERKFRLRAAPDAAALAAHGADAQRMEQVYLADGVDGGGRVRRTVRADGTATYRRTTKRRIGAYAFDEDEEVIDEAAWAEALRHADPERRPVRKVRYVVPHGGQELEIDVFEVPAGLVVVEVELDHEDEPVALPAWLGEWREVTGDDGYFNASLARLDAEVPPWA
jgi:adenylate cyclase